MMQRVGSLLISWSVIFLISQPAYCGITVSRRIDLSAYEQPWAKMCPGDLDGDGRIDFLFTSGTRVARAIRNDGTLLWEIVNSKGVTNSEPWHPWTAAIWDIDNDGANEAIIFRKRGDDPVPYLAIVRGQDGTIKAERRLWFEATTDGYRRRGLFAIAYMRHRDIADIVVGSDDTLSDVAAFDAQLNQLWYRAFGSADKPDYAGHYIWPYDINDDGLHEVFVGKRVFNGEGKELWSMKDLGSDHVDSLVSGDIDLDIAGREVVVCGRSGTRMYDCKGKLIWKIPTDIIRDPQRLVLGEFRKESRGLEAVVTERHSADRCRTVLVDCKGRLLSTESPFIHSGKMQIDWDGDRSQDELLGQENSSGTVEDGQGRKLVWRDWYLREGQQFHWMEWWPYPLAIDIEGDSREEIIQWGTRDLVIGANDAPNPAPAPSLGADREYRLRYANLYMNRAPMYFEYRKHHVQERRSLSVRQ